MSNIVLLITAAYTYYLIQSGRGEEKATISDVFIAAILIMWMLSWSH